MFEPVTSIFSVFFSGAACANTLPADTAPKAPTAVNAQMSARGLKFCINYLVSGDDGVTLVDADYKLLPRFVEVKLWSHETQCDDV
jgi:hypothetical protein